MHMWWVGVIYHGWKERGALLLRQLGFYRQALEVAHTVNMKVP